MASIAVLAVAYVLSQFFRSFLAVLTPSLIADLGATKADLATASGAWFIAFALMQFIVGVSLDRFGPRRTAAVLLGVCGAGGAALFAVATAPWMVTAAMVLIGIGCSPVLMASFYIFAKQFPPARFAVLASWIVAFGMIGNVVGASPLAAAAGWLGWRAVIAILGGVTLAVAIAILYIVRDPEADTATPAAGSGFAGYLALIRMRALWLLLPLMLVNYVTAAGIRSLWAGPYLVDVYAADQAAIGDVTLFMALAMVAGSFLYGPLDTIFRTRKWVVFAGNLVCAVVCAYLALYPVAGLTAVTVAFVIIGIAGSSFGVLMAHGRAFFPAHLTGRGVTLMNFFGIGGVGLMQWVTGALVTAKADPAAPETAYGALFWFYALIGAGALAVYVFSRDKKPETG